MTSRFSSHERSGLKNGPRPHQCAAQHLWSGAGTRSAGTASARPPRAQKPPPGRAQVPGRCRPPPARGAGRGLKETGGVGAGCEAHAG